MRLVAERRQFLKGMGSAGIVPTIAFNQKLAEANQCKLDFPGHPELIAACKAHTVNEALWNSGMHNAPVVNTTCNGRKGPTVLDPTEWSGDIYIPAKGGRTQRRRRNKRRATRNNRR